MLSKIIKRVYHWVIKKETNKKIKIQKEQRKEIYKKLRELYSFVQWLNNNFTNRRERKIFWRNVSRGKPILEQTLETLVKKYETKEKKERRILKGYQPKGNENEEFEPPKGGSGLVK